MSTITKRDARKNLQKVLIRELGTFAPSQPKSAAGGVVDMAKVTHRIVKILETHATVASYVALLNPPASESRIKTEEVATMLGYSRPYVAALLDSDEFAGLVQKSKGGQRSIKRSDVSAWMDSRQMGGPARLAKTSLLADSPEEFFTEPAMSSAEEKSALMRIAKENKASDMHRPKRRAAST